MTVYHEYKRASGELMTLTGPTDGWYHVDQWDKEDNNRWHRQYKLLDAATAEFERWRDVQG